MAILLSDSKTAIKVRTLWTKVRVAICKFVYSSILDKVVKLIKETTEKNRSHDGV